jgi:hypothetical protein
VRAQRAAMRSKRAVRARYFDASWNPLALKLVSDASLRADALPNKEQHGSIYAR